MTEISLFKGLDSNQELQTIFEITTRSRQAGLIAALHGVSYVREDSWHVTFPPGSYRYSSDEVFNWSNRRFVHQTLNVTPKEEVHTGPVIWQANESGHQSGPLSKGYVEMFNERQLCYVEPRHAGTTCSGATTEEHVQCQVVQAEVVTKKIRYALPSKRLGRRYGPMK